MEGIGLKSLAWSDTSHMTLEKVLHLKNDHRNSVLLIRLYKATIYPLATSFGGNICTPG